MKLDKTSNGIPFSEDISSIDGASFILFPKRTHSPEEIAFAKREIRVERDVVSLKVAKEEDKDEQYKSEIFSHPETRKLKWYQIEQDENLIRRERKKGTTPNLFVLRYVLPYIKRTEKKFKKEHGESMYQI